MGSLISSSRVRGTSPWWRSSSALAMPSTDFVFARKKPVDWISRSKVFGFAGSQARQPPAPGGDQQPGDRDEDHVEYPEPPEEGEAHEHYDTDPDEGRGRPLPVQGDRRFPTDRQDRGDRRDDGHQPADREPGRGDHAAAWDGRAGIGRAVGSALDRRGSTALGATPARPARGSVIPPHSAAKLEPQTGHTGRLTARGSILHVQR